MIEGFLTLHAPRMPSGFRIATFAASFALHMVGAIMVFAVLSNGPRGVTAPDARAMPADQLRVPRLVFLATAGSGRGGGGGGNRQPAPIRRAHGVGRDRVTVAIARPLTVTTDPVDEPAPGQQSLLLDARPSASGLIEHIGAIEGGVEYGTSRGPGSGGGVGSGRGTGTGSGTGPGLGPGSGGGTGGGEYRPGGSVDPPTIRFQIRPSYTNDALRRRIQGSVILELIVRKDGEPTDIRIVRSLDPGGLDQQAVEAVQQWRFEPGRAAGIPVDVMVTVVLDFRVR